MPAQILFAPPAPPTFFGTAVQAARVCRRGSVVAEAAAPGPTPATAPAAPAAKPSAVALPGYQIVMSPHLRDYLGPIPSMPNPQLKSRNRKNFVAPNDVVLGDIVIPGGEGARDRPLAAYIRAGPREQVFFEEGVRAAIVTCGGICPGINTVIRELTMSLLRYGAAKVFGVQHGYRGFYGEHWRDLTAESVDGIHKLGGSVLGSSRGGFDVVKIVDAIETRDIDQVYVIGGDGTIMGCQKIFHEIKHRRLKTSVVSVPKTIDNDIAIIDLSFGFETAVHEAQRAINAAYVEAISFPNCVAIVKLSTSALRFVNSSIPALRPEKLTASTLRAVYVFVCVKWSTVGRNSGFIACHSALASREVDCCLIPEERFSIREAGGVLEYVRNTLDKKGFCVLVVAEGAGHEEYGSVDIGLHLLSEVKAYFQERGREVSTKYLDPTYQVRAVPTTTHDNILCILMAHSAVHGAFAGYTGFSSGIINSRNAYMPIDSLAGIQKKLDTSGSMWSRLRASTGQPDWAARSK